MSTTRWFRTLGLGVFVLACHGLWGDQAPAPFNALEKIQMGPAHTETQEVSLSVGSSAIRFSGAWSPLLQNGKPVGYYLKGQGTLSYTSSFAPEQPVFTRNLKEWTSLKVVKNGDTLAVTIPFKEARIFLGGSVLPPWEGPGSAPMEDSFRQFEQRWNLVEHHVPLHLLAMQAANAPWKTVASVDLEDGGRRWIFQHDGVDQMEETLSCLRSYPNPRANLKGILFKQLLSRQYLGWDPRKGQIAPTHFLLTSLDVDLRAKDKRNADMVVQETILPLEDGLQVFTFKLWSTLETEEDTRVLRIKEIRDAEGNPIEYHHVRDEVALRLPAAARRGTPFTLRVEYGGDFLIQPDNDNYWELPLGSGWYPTPNNMASEWYSFHGTVRTPDDWISFLPGETVRREKDGTWNLLETRTKLPICFATILAGKYYLDEESHDGLTVRVATYGFKPGAANTIFKTQAFNVIRYYERFLGPFPFKEFTIVEKNDWGYGQAPPGMMYITRDAFEQIQSARQLQAVADQVEALKRTGRWIGALPSMKTMDVRHVFAHEIAHQYWGITVKMPNLLEQWVTESFADYCAGLFEKDYKGKGLWDRNLATWGDGAESARFKAPIPLANDLAYTDTYDTFYTRRNLLYNKGPLLLAVLHQEQGDQAFLTWLKSIQTNFKGKFVTTKQLFNLLGYITKKDFKDFYDEYFWDMGLPKLKR